MFNSFREQYKNISFCKRSFVLKQRVHLPNEQLWWGISSSMEHMLLLAREWVWHLLCPVLTFNRRRPLREILQYSSTRICQKNINKSKCFLTQNTSQWNVLLTSFKVLLSHIRWFSRWFGLWFQGNNLIQGKNLRGSFVNVLNLSLGAGNIFKASIGMI